MILIWGLIHLLKCLIKYISYSSYLLHINPTLIKLKWRVHIGVLKRIYAISKGGGVRIAMRAADV